MISSILIPTDFSPASWTATQVGLELSRLSSESTISFLHIYPNSAKYSSKDTKKASQQVLEEMKDRMNQLSLSLSDQPMERINNVVLSGNVEDTMLKFIKEHKFDLVIVGVNSNGLNNEIGSHTVSLIEKSGTPVLVVPNNPAPYGAIAS